MNTKFSRRALAFLTAMTIFSSMTAAQAAETVGTAVTAEDLSLKGCAENIKRVYKERYPEQGEMIEEIVDIISADEQFICIFEQEGAAAFRIIEDSLRDALEPAVMPIVWDEDLYSTGYYFPVIKQAEDTFCGAASIVMALMGGGKVNWTADTAITNKMQYDIATETGIWDPKTNSKIKGADNKYKGIEIGVMRNYLQKYFPADSTGLTYQRKIFTRFHTSDIEGFLATALVNDTLPILYVNEPQRLNYYPSSYSSGPHYIVVKWVDFASGEVGVVDPHYLPAYLGEHVVSLDEIKKLPNKDSSLWMCVCTRTGEAADDYTY